MQRLDKLAEAGEESVTGARSTYYPNVGLYGGYEWGGIGLAQGGTFSGAGWLVGVQSSWAIFDGRLTAGKVIQAKSQLRQARLSRLAGGSRRRHRGASGAFGPGGGEGVGDGLAADGRGGGGGPPPGRQPLQGGIGTQLDVLTSQVALTQARTNQIQANYNYLVAVAGMRKAMGLGDALVSD